MLTFGAGMGAVFAVAGNVENGAELFLEFERFTHQLFRTGVVIDGRQDGEGLLAGKQDGFRMAHDFRKRKWKRVSVNVDIGLANCLMQGGRRN